MVRCLLEEATLALGSLDAVALEALSERALALQALLSATGGHGGIALPETQARFRVFASVLQSTQDNLIVAEGGKTWGR